MPPRHPRLHAERTPDKPAIIMAGGGVRSYSALAEGSDRAARLFSRLGLRRGDVVALLLENHPRFFEIVWATHNGGFYLTPLSTQLTPPELAHILNDSGARLLVTSAAQANNALAACALAPGVKQVLMFDGAVGTAIAAEAAIAAEGAGRAAEDGLQGGMLLYSSGTTGVPKGIKPELRDLPPDRPPALAERLIELYDIDGATIYLSPAPLYHTAPLKWNMAVQIAGGTCVVMERFDAAESLALIERHRITHSQWVPTMLQRLLRLLPQQRERDLGSHRVAVHAAAPCPPSLKRSMIDWWGPILHEYYAGTESNGLTALDSHEWLKRPGSVGRSMRGTLHIMAEDGETGLAPGKPGLIYFDGGTPFEYHRDPEKTARARNSRGWTTIGDIGWIDADGYLYLTDRRDDVIIAGGVNIYPQEIEQLLAAHPLVADVAVLGVPNADFGEEVKAVVQLSEPAADARADLRAWLEPRLAAYKRPRSYDFVESLPRLPTGKLLKRVLRQTYWGEASATAAITSNSKEGTGL